MNVSFIFDVVEGVLQEFQLKKQQQKTKKQPPTNQPTSQPTNQPTNQQQKSPNQFNK